MGTHTPESQPSYLPVPPTSPPQEGRQANPGHPSNVRNPDCARYFLESYLKQPTLSVTSDTPQR